MKPMTGMFWDLPESEIAELRREDAFRQQQSAIKRQENQELARRNRELWARDLRECAL
jgi:hypothetical protein